MINPEDPVPEDDEETLRVAIFVEALIFPIAEFLALVTVPAPPGKDVDKLRLSVPRTFVSEIPVTKKSPLIFMVSILVAVGQYY